MKNVQCGQEGIEIVLIETSEFEHWLESQSLLTNNWLNAQKPKPTGVYQIPNAKGDVEKILVVASDKSSTWALAEAAKELPATNYFIANAAEDIQITLGLGWLLSQYEFNRYKETTTQQPTLFLANDSAVKLLIETAKSVYLTRNLVNTPAADMMPQHLSSEMKALATEFSANFSEIVGDDLLAKNFPTIHMVGRASVHAPRLLDLSWGDENAPKLTLVGKGVCFDSGGLDLKAAAGMRLMKKDMGGAAHVLGLARLIMVSNLPVRLRVLVPAVENAVNGDAFRPGDIVKTRKGLTVEIDNTDAEGRLVLCDALALADDESPDLIIDFATLTGAARVALGLEVPAFFSTSDEFSNSLSNAGKQVEDEVWQLPLHQGYKDFIKGTISDLINCGPKPFGGSITAALYLQYFVEKSPWVHFDVGAWNDRTRPGRPAGGEAMGLRAVFLALQQRYPA